jgi:pSer/pThr/pTyr-binding forkhead associated (FHA) protein
MATTARRQHTGQTGQRDTFDHLRATDRLVGLRTGPRDPMELLDYRTRRQLIAVSDAAPGAYLAFEGREGMRLFHLAPGATTIGRALRAEIRLDDCHISRQHATLTHDGERTQLLDSRSLNGTWVNGERVVSTALHSGDLIEIGPLVARYLQLL